MRKAVVIGANGQLGMDVARALTTAGHETIGLTHADLEIADDVAVADVLARLQPAVVVNTAAFHHVEACEKDPARAFAVNALGARNLARYCAAADAYLVHVSTDYVFDGAKKAPYAEDDVALPLNTYGNSKLAGENYVRAMHKKAAVIRVSGVYGTHPCRAKGGLNFVQLMLKLAKERPEIRVVDDEILTPTSTVDIARQTVKLVDQDAAGLFHATAQGSCSWYEFARAIFEASGTAANLQKANPGEFPTKVQRPSYSVLDNKRLASAGIDVMPDWQTGLNRYLRELGV